MKSSLLVLVPLAGTWLIASHRVSLQFGMLLIALGLALVTVWIERGEK